MAVRDRLKAYLKEKNISQADFAIGIGASTGYVNAIVKTIGSDKLAIIREKFPDLNISWLLTGEGAMLKTDAPENDFADQVPSAHLVPLLPLYAQGGPRCRPPA